MRRDRPTLIPHAGRGQPGKRHRRDPVPNEWDEHSDLGYGMVPRTPERTARLGEDHEQTATGPCMEETVKSSVPAWRTLLESAVRAPSPHNVQPWRLCILDASRAEVRIERSRTLPNEDVTGSFILLTMGLFIESLRLVAAHHGCELEEELLDSLDAFSADRLAERPQPFFPFARLTLRPSGSVRQEFPLELFAQRRTSRLAYGPERVHESERAQLAAVAERLGQRYRQTHDPAVIEDVLAVNTHAAFEELNHAPYRNELASWLRYTSGDSARRRDGLDARCLNQHPVELWLAFHCPAALRWSLTRTWFAHRYRRQIGPVPTLGFLCGGFWKPTDAYGAGRALIHFWLECTRLGYYLHPYGNLVTHRPSAARVEARMGFSGIWLVFKIGRSPVPPLSHRLPIEEILE